MMILSFFFRKDNAENERINPTRCKNAIVHTVSCACCTASGPSPVDVLLERYDLKRRLEKWQKIEWDFLADLRQENRTGTFY